MGQSPTLTRRRGIGGVSCVWYYEGYREAGSPGTRGGGRSARDNGPSATGDHAACVARRRGIRGASVWRCGSSGGSTSTSGGVVRLQRSTTTRRRSVGSDAQAAAKAAIEKGSKIPQFSLHAEPFDASKAKGRPSSTSPCRRAIPYVAAVDTQMKKVAKEQRHQVRPVREPGQPDAVGVGHQPGHLQKADLIVLEAGNDPQLRHPAAASARRRRTSRCSSSTCTRTASRRPESVLDLITAT